MLDPATKELLAALRDPHPSDPIILAYPTLFDLDLLQSSMQFGLQIPASWRGTIEQLCQRLQPLATDQTDFKILSVKEKFGSLRIAYRRGTPEIEAEIERATKLLRGQPWHLCRAPRSLFGSR
jgi:hypothetical protein